MPNVFIDIIACLTFASILLYVGMCIGLTLKNREERIAKRTEKHDEVFITVINKDAIVEWLCKIPLHDLGGGNRVIFEDDFKKAMNGLPAGTDVVIKKERTE